MTSAWLFDRRIGIDPQKGLVVVVPARIAVTLVGIAVAALPLALGLGAWSGRVDLSLRGYVLLGAYAFVAVALFVMPWLPGNRRRVVDLVAREVTVGDRREALVSAEVERAVDHQGRPRARLHLVTASGARHEVLYLANDGTHLVEGIARAISDAGRGEAPGLAALTAHIEKLHRQSVLTAGLLAVMGLGLGAYFASQVLRG